MTFYPVKFWPPKPFHLFRIANTGFPIGWQGIVPFKAVEMACMACEIIQRELIDVEEMFSRLTPEGLARTLEPTLEKQMQHIVSLLGRSYAPKLWNVLPDAAKRKIITNAQKNAPDVIAGMVTDMRKDINACFDIQALVVGVLSKDPDLTNHMFIACGFKELRFIRDCGAWMGLFFGIVQMILYYFYDAHWVLPVFGLIVGAFTNWIALAAVFKPTTPIPINLGCYRFELRSLPETAG